MPPSIHPLGLALPWGRDNNLPAIFGRIHAQMKTPHYAVALSAVLIIVMGLLLPIEEVAAAADVMFLFMFAQVNVTVIRLRELRPDLDRGYFVPFFPWPAIIGIVTNLALGIFVAYEVGRVGLGFAGLDYRGCNIVLGLFSAKRRGSAPPRSVSRTSFGVCQLLGCRTCRQYRPS